MPGACGCTLYALRSGVSRWPPALWRSDSVKAFRIRIHVLEAQRERERFIISSQFSAQLSVVGRYYMSLSYEGRVGNCAGFLLSRICKKFQSQGPGTWDSWYRCKVTNHNRLEPCRLPLPPCKLSRSSPTLAPAPSTSCAKAKLTSTRTRTRTTPSPSFPECGTWYVTDGVQQVALQSFLVPFVIFDLCPPLYWLKFIV